MTDRLAWDEIKKRYPDEFVVMIDLDADAASNEVHAGVVLDHSRSRKDLLVRTKDALAGRSAAVLFTGEVGKGNYLF